jgi:dTDP-4-amino-4,6-dideoxygalactose transaminase
MLAFKALEIGKGDEVIVPSHTFVATVNGFWHYGARPKFVDIDLETYTMDPEKVRKAVTKRTAAIVPVHIYGHPADMAPILEIGEELDIPVIGDAAQSHGAKYRGVDIGKLGDMTCYSFFPSKIITVAGEGGMITCGDEELHILLQALKDHGRYPDDPDGKYRSTIAGFNMRLPELLAAIGNVQLSHMEEWIERRRAIASRYDRELQGVGDLVLPVEKEWARHVYYLYVVRVKASDRKPFMDHLRSAGIATGIHYPIPVHRMPYIGRSSNLPVTERIVDEIVSLPMHPLMTEEEQSAVITSVKAFFKHEG